MLGRLGEEAAYWRLRQDGFIMVSRNYQPKGMREEIDLIGWEGETLVFIEVKARSAGSLLSPETAVDLEKQRHLIAASRHYRRSARLLAAPYRFDIVSVTVTPKGNPNGDKIQHFRDAFREIAGTLRT